MLNSLKQKFYPSIFLLLSSILFGQMVRIPVCGKIILVSDIAVFAFLVWGIIIFREKLKNIKSHYLFWPILAFISAAILSLIIALPSLGLIKTVTAGMYLARWAMYAAIVFIISLFPDKNKLRETVFWGICGAALLLSIFGFIQLKIHPDFGDMVKFGWDPHKNRLLSTWYDPNLLAGFLGIAMGLITAKIAEISNFKFQISKQFLISNFQFQKYFDKFLYFFISLFLYLAFVLTYSRSGYLALLAIFIVLLIFKFSYKFLILGIVVCIATLLIFPRSYQRVNDAAHIDVTSQMRIDSWSDAKTIIKSHPIFGVGFNALEWRWSVDRPEHAVSGSDSSLLTIWATTGIIGLAAYIWIFGAILFNQFKIFYLGRGRKFSAPTIDVENQIFALGVFAAIIAILVHSMFVNSLLYPHVMMAIWIVSCVFYTRHPEVPRAPKDPIIQ